MQRRKGLRLRGGSKWAAILIIAVVLIGFDLLADNASIVNRGIVVGLAVDSGGDLVELAAQVILPRSGGSASGGNDFMIFTSSGETMQDAVEKARAAAKPGDVVSLSPASASFDLYPNFEERGRDYKRIVMALQ